MNELKEEDLIGLPFDEVLRLIMERLDELEKQMKAIT